MEGTVKRLERQKGFGFIRTTAGAEYFFHRSAVADFDTLQEGDRVLFEEEASTKGPRAKAVRKQR